MPEHGQEDRAARRPTFELRREIGPGTYVGYLNFWWRPTGLCVFLFGKWRWVKHP